MTKQPCATFDQSHYDGRFKFNNSNVGPNSYRTDYIAKNRQAYSFGHAKPKR